MRMPQIERMDCSTPQATALCSLKGARKIECALALPLAYALPAQGTLMISVADIKKDLPDFPDDVIEDWLHYFANEDCGWPPPEPPGDHRWGRLLGGRSLSWWKEVTWKKEMVKCDPDSLAPKTRAIAATMVTEIGNGTADAVTKRRYQQALLHILDHGAFFKPIVAMKTPTGLLVLDGNHRIGAFCGAQILPDAWFAKLNKKRPSLEQEAWIGRHSRGEKPIT